MGREGVAGRGRGEPEPKSWQPEGVFELPGGEGEELQTANCKLAGRCRGCGAAKQPCCCATREGFAVPTAHGGPMRRVFAGRFPVPQEQGYLAGAASSERGLQSAAGRQHSAGGFAS